MAGLKNLHGPRKSLIVIGILAVLGIYWISENILKPDQIVSTANAKQNDDIEGKFPDSGSQAGLPDVLRASGKIDWSIIYSGNETERSRISAAIAEASSIYGVKSDLLRAVIMTESLFNSKAVSSKGARGLMQLMPGTARELGVSDPQDSRENILGGAAYLAGLLKEFDGDLRASVAAYNLGPQAIHRANGEIPREILPYVNRVLSYYRLFGGGRDG